MRQAAVRLGTAITGLRSSVIVLQYRVNFYVILVLANRRRPITFADPLYIALRITLTRDRGTA